jgi:4-amino-4-deoxy-L-arabinose transferase-like glycosyltransferase
MTPPRKILRFASDFSTLPQGEGQDLLRLAVGIIAAITVVRVVVLIVSPLQLYPDEAQYWWWAQNLDWGYFSKPPLIAWIIRLTTIAGDQEWAIRLASPLLHGATALLLFGIGRLAYDARVGFWSALAYATLPGISYSSGLISTDVPLLFCWATALYAFLRGLDDPRWRWAMVCGAAFGFGLLAKYAMAYFVLCAILAAVMNRKARAFVLSWRAVVALVLSLAILSPNLLWNAAHGWPTFVHTQSNANWSHAHYSFGNAGSFVLGQFGVFGPLMMAGYLGALWRLALGKEKGSSTLVLAAFSVPVLVLIVAQSFISDANANWAASAYVSPIPLAIVELLSWWRGRALAASFAIAAIALLALWTGQVSPAAADRLGLGNALKRETGWRELGREVAVESHRAPYDAIATANRSVLAEFLYYARPRTVPIRAWDANPVPRDHFQMTMPLTPSFHRVLLAIAPNEAPKVLATFDSVKPLHTLVVSVGAHRTRTLALYDASGYRGSQPRR